MINFLIKLLALIKKYFHRDSTPERDYSLKEIDTIVRPKYKIGISPGHGGNDTGAKGRVMTEAVLAREIAKKIYSAFCKNPYFDVVIHDPGINRPKNYVQRVKNSDTRSEDYYIPVHLNSWKKPDVNGWLVFADPKDVASNYRLEELCFTVLEYLNNAYNIGWRDWDDKKDGFMAGIGRKIYEQYKPKAQTVYLELGFISNPDWEKKLVKEDTQIKIAQAIVGAFESFLGLPK